MKHPAMLLLATSVCLTSAVQAGAEFDAAMSSYERGDYVKALSQFRIVAEHGDAQAQELLGFMYAVGVPLYPGVDRSAAQAQHWFKLAAQGGRPVAAYMHCVLQRRPSSTTDVASPAPCAAENASRWASRHPS